MPTFINSTSTGLIITPDATGALTLQANGVTALTANTTGYLNFAKQPTIGGGEWPAFSAYRSSSNQSFSSGTWTALSAQTEEYDTIGAYNNTGSTTTLNGISVPAYSFAPNIAGYYQVSGEVNVTCTSGSQGNISIYKNGSEFKRGFAIVGGSFSQYCMPVSAIVYMNGSTDYLTLYAVIVGTSPLFVSAGNGEWCYFQAALIRGA